MIDYDGTSISFAANSFGIYQCSSCDQFDRAFGAIYQGSPGNQLDSIDQSYSTISNGALIWPILWLS